MKAFELPGAIFCGECGRFMHYEDNYKVNKKSRIFCLTSGCKNEGIPFIAPVKEISLEVATDG